MQRAALFVALAVVAGACAGGSGSTTTVAPSTTQTTGPPPTVTVTVTAPPPEALELLAVGQQELVVLPSGRSLTPGLGAALTAVFDDFAGGVVFARSDQKSGIWHLSAGRDSPTLLLEGGEDAVPELLDVASPNGRPPTALVRLDDVLLLIGLTGGAADELAIPGLATDSGSSFGTASLGGDLLMVAWVEGDCISVNLYDLDGTLAIEELFAACGTDLPVMSDEGDVIVAVEQGPSTKVVVRSTSDGLERSRWQIPGAVGRPHVSGGRVALGDGDGTVYTVSYRGDIETTAAVTAGAWQSVTLARSELMISDLATLGGIALLTTCSADSRPPLAVQDGLTQAAVVTRAAISNAAIDCDVPRLASFAAPSFVGPTDDPVDYWLTQEGASFPVLLELVDLLAIPYASVETEDGTFIYVWPSAAVIQDDAEAWQALRALYNEEDIDRWSSGAEPYDRLVIRITEDGDWIQASSDF